MQDPDGYMGGVWKSFADVMAIYRNKGPSVRLVKCITLKYITKIPVFPFGIARCGDLRTTRRGPLVMLSSCTPPLVNHYACRTRSCARQACAV